MCAVPSHPMGRFPWDSHRNDIPMDKPANFPLRCETAQYHQIICAVKSDSGTLATFQNVGKVRKQGEAI